MSQWEIYPPLALASTQPSRESEQTGELSVSPISKPRKCWLGALALVPFMTSGASPRQRYRNLLAQRIADIKEREKCVNEVMEACNALRLDLEADDGSIPKENREAYEKALGRIIQDVIFQPSPEIRRNIIGGSIPL